MVQYCVSLEVSASNREAHRDNAKRLGYILDRADKIKKTQIRIIDAGLAVAQVRSSRKENQIYNVDLERMLCSCPAAIDAICSHLRAVARVCGGEAR